MYYCLLCKAARHELEMEPIYENDDVFAYIDTNKWGEIHVEEVAKKHYGLVDYGTPEFWKTVRALDAAIPAIAEKAGMKKILHVFKFDQEPHITQNQRHLHYHILGSADPNAPEMGAKELGAIFLTSFSKPENNGPGMGDSKEEKK